MKGWHRIADDITHEPGWLDFTMDALMREIGQRLGFEAWADRHGEALSDEPL